MCIRRDPWTLTVISRYRHAKIKKKRQYHASESYFVQVQV